MTDDDLDAKVRRLRRRRAATIGACALHEQRPEIAAEAGAKGAAATYRNVRDRGEYAAWLARRRWYGEAAGPPPEKRPDAQGPR